MLKITNLSKSFDKNVVINDLSVEFPEKGLVTVTGPSGKGKTTLLNIIADIIKADSGSIEGLRSSLSYSFQDDRLFPWLSLKKNIEIVLDNAEEKEKIVSEWLEKVELSDFADYLPEKISGGMKQRVSLARALAYPSEIVLLDEPFKGLDEDLHQRMYELVKTEAQNRLIIMVTHDKNNVSEINIEI